MSLAKIQPSVHKKITLICMSDLRREGLSTFVQSKGFVMTEVHEICQIHKVKRRNTEHGKSQVLLQESLDVLDCVAKTCIFN